MAAIRILSCAAKIKGFTSVWFGLNLIFLFSLRSIASKEAVFRSRFDGTLVRYVNTAWKIVQISVQIIVQINLFLMYRIPVDGHFSLF